MHDGPTDRLGIVVPTLNNIVKKIKETKECYKKCGRCSGQTKGLEHLPVKNWECVFAWFQQAIAIHAVIRGTLIKERLHIATGMGSEDSPPLMAGLATVLWRDVLGQWKSLHLTKHWLWKGILKWWEKFQADSNNSISPQCRWDWQTPIISHWEQRNENLCCFTIIVSVPTRYGANRKSWIKEATFIDYLKALDAKVSSQKRKMLLFIHQCATYPQDKLLTAY
jgi:hypothetical protein